MVDILKKLKANQWNIDEEFFALLSDYEKSFVEYEMGFYKNLDFYKKRLSMIGFERLPKVLDAGSGIGQWSVALSYLNKYVEAIDISTQRVKFASSMAQISHVENCSFQVGSLESLPYDNETFDGIFCFGVFMFTDTERTLQEFKRVLKPGGKMYLNFNSLGWYAHLIIDRGIKQKNFNIIKQAIIMCLRHFVGYKSQILIRTSTMRKLLEEYKFNNIRFGPEGSLTPMLPPNTLKPHSIYAPQYYSINGVVEVLAEKNL